MIKHDTVYVGAQAMPQFYRWFNFHFDLNVVRCTWNTYVKSPHLWSIMLLHPVQFYTLQFMMHFAQVK